MLLETTGITACMKSKISSSKTLSLNLLQLFSTARIWPSFSIHYLELHLYGGEPSTYFMFSIKMCQDSNSCRKSLVLMCVKLGIVCAVCRLTEDLKDRCYTLQLLTETRVPMIFFLFIL
jgi:hypothetical protein